MIGCFPEGVRQLMTFDQLRPRRPVTLTGVRGGGRAMAISRSWVAPLPAGAIDASGVVDVDAPGATLDDVEAWAERRPLPGAELVPGTTYTFFVRATVRPDRRLDDFTFAWDDGTSTGESGFDHAGRTRSDGC